MFVVDDRRAPEFGLTGFYSQPYNEIVKTNQVWRVSKYFLRRWGPYLGPTRFWAVVAARQLCYLNDHRDWFAGYDAQIAAEAQVSRAHYRRIKGEMGEAASPLSLFITREETGYHVVNGKTRPQPTTYHVRLDEPLTPADAAYLALWLQNRPVRPQTAEVVALLQEAAELPRQALLAPHFGAALQRPPDRFAALTVGDIIEQVFGHEIAHQPPVRKQAEVLHNHLTDTDFVGKQYMRREWLPLLRHGPAFLLVYLRSLCYFNEDTGELRNELTINRQTLAEALGVQPNTLSEWFKTLADAAPPQAVPPFVTLRDSGRTADNSFEFYYEIGMLDPLVPGDVERYADLAARYAGSPGDGAAEGPSDFARHDARRSAGPQSENEPHDQPANRHPESEIERHGKAAAAPGESDFARHDKLAAGPGGSENEIHGHGEEVDRRGPWIDFALHGAEHNPNLRAPQPASEPPSTRESAPFKYYQSLLTLEEEDLNHLLTAEAAGAGWKLNRAHLPVAQACCPTHDDLYDLLEIDAGGPARRRLHRGGLSVAETAAWWLYARTQARLHSPLPLVIARAAAGVPPPASFQALAELSWEIWRSYAVVRHLPPTDRPDWPEKPHYDQWMALYGDLPAGELPFGVGEGLPEAVEFVYARRAAGRHPEPPARPDLWPALLEAVAPSLDPTLAGIFLGQASVQARAAGRLTIAVPDQTARAFWEQALAPRLVEAARSLTGSAWQFTFVLAGSEPPKAAPAAADWTAHFRPLWAAARSELALQMTRATFERWLQQAELVEADERTLRVGVAGENGRQWLDHRLKKTIVRTLRALGERDDLEVEFVVVERPVHGTGEWSP